mmetsp:Transcript_36598/g.117629  ORF Transcript_36598/g.117629 Transcript_36598/m.117629 type:complete len:157 (+) Transcript_36598:592-1062(+)
MEQRVQEEMNEEMRQWRHKELERLQKLSEVQRKVETAKHHIEEEVICLRCPRCCKVFFDFDGCMSLSCGNCPCCFCGYCMKDCGSDAHRCAASHGEVFMPFLQFQEHHKERRGRYLQEYLGTLEPDVRKMLLKEMQGTLQGIISDHLHARLMQEAC